ncbi:MAG: hypothetical protein COS34_10560 [Lysobacterales bacterium CG02_land_8_20_14_3_00_62_12]|nr:MAG: hypothetical protein COS34_10560 [Xanthomonadales bacterium CG02_land_8_20_14_3_00_62_12]
MPPAKPNRRLLLIIVLSFAAPLLVALGLHWQGWIPLGRKNYGELLAPPLPLTDAALADGSVFHWRTPAWYWTLLVRVPGDCSQACRAHLRLLPNLRQSLDRNAPKLRIAIVDALPADTPLARTHGVYLLAPGTATQLPSALPTAVTDIALAVVDPNGYLILRYPENANLSRLRTDLLRLVK